MEKKNNDGERLTDEDLLTEILSRVDVKSLLRSKAVSKTWCSLISSPGFMKSHYQCAIARCCKDDETLIIQHYVNEYEENELKFSLLQLNSGLNVLPDLKFPFSEGEYPVEPHCKLIGCHFGIVCVSVSVWVTDFPRNCRIARNQTDIYLWNPATRQSKLIPSQDYWDIDTIGFGFDDIGNDFKVVRVVSSLCQHGYGFYVYSANTNIWRTFENYTSRDVSSFVFELHLRSVLYCRNYNFIVGFNLNKEQFVCRIQIPYAPSVETSLSDFCITEFKGSVAVITFVLGRQLWTEKFDLWTLNNDACLYDSEVEASWNILFTIDIGVPVGFIKGYFNLGDFLCHFKDHGWFVYNSEKETVTDVPAYIIGTKVFKYTESLLSIEGSKPVNWTAS